MSDIVIEPKVKGSQLSHVEFNSIVDAVNSKADRIELEAESTARASALSDEASARTLAIQGEATSRANADNNLQAALDAEETARIAADTTLQSNIAAEETARTAADTTLQENIDSEASTRATADTVLQDNINAEASTRASADNSLSTAISNETTARTNADTTLQNNINSEASTRASADTTLQNNITAEATARANADSTLQTTVNNKVDKVTGKGLSTNDYSNTDKAKVDGIGLLQYVDETADFTISTTTHGGKFIRATKNTGDYLTVTIPANLTDMPVGSVIWVRQAGSVPVFVGASYGVTLNSVNGVNTTSAKHTVLKLHKEAANNWTLEGLNLILETARAQAHIDRVTADGGVIPSAQRVKDACTVLLSRPLSDYTALTDPHISGYKIGASADKISKLYSLIPASDLIQNTAAYQFMVTPHDGVNNYWSGPGISQNYIESSLTTASLTGDIDMDVEIQLDTQSGTNTIIGAYNTSIEGFRLSIDASNRLVFSFVVGTANISGTSSVITGISAGARFFGRATRVVSTGVINFYTSTDRINWTLLSSTTQTSGAIAIGTTPIRIGTHSPTSSLTYKGRTYSARIYNGIRESGGVLLLSFDARDYRKAVPTNVASWVSALTLETYTINRSTGTAGYVGDLVDRTKVQSDTVDDFMEATGTFTVGTTYAPLTFTDAFVAGSTKITIGVNAGVYKRTRTGLMAITKVVDSAGQMTAIKDYFKSLTGLDYTNK